MVMECISFWHCVARSSASRQSFRSFWYSASRSSSVQLADPVTTACVCECECRDPNEGSLTCFDAVDLIREVLARVFDALYDVWLDKLTLGRAAAHSRVLSAHGRC